MISASGKWALYGSCDSSILVAGHSHAAALLEAKLSNQASLDLARIGICYSKELSSGPPGDNDYWNFVAEMSQGKDLAIVWNGNQHNANFLFQTMPPFTISAISSLTLAEGEVPITNSMMRAFFEPSFDELREIIPMMSSAESVYLVTGPAPKPLIHIKERITQEKFFTDIADSLGVRAQDLEITSDSLRVELWKILSEMLTEIAVELNVGFINSPEDSLDSNGLLREIFWTPDVTHANAAYGELLARKICSSIETGL